MLAGVFIGSDAYITDTNVLCWLACLHGSGLHITDALLSCWLACLHRSGVYIIDTSLLCRLACLHGSDVYITDNSGKCKMRASSSSRALFVDIHSCTQIIQRKPKDNCVHNTIGVVNQNKKRLELRQQRAVSGTENAKIYSKLFVVDRPPKF